MIKTFKYRYLNLILHILVWSIVLFFPFWVSTDAEQYKIGPVPGRYFIYSGIVHIFIFYLNAFLLYPKLLNRTYWMIYVAAVVLLIFLSYRVKYYMLVTGFPDAAYDARSHVLFPSVLVFIASVFYSITADKVRAEKQEKAREAARLEMELKFLRSQISPHFLFNIMTTLVYLARKKSASLEASLLMLSGLMRYMLYDTGKKITLQQEVEYLESYVSLQQLRFGRDVKIAFNRALSEEEANEGIEPMLLIPFIENAFKHGTGYADQPFIDISLTVQARVLVFSVKNQFDRKTDISKYESHGIGLNNVRSRLTLLYPDRHELVIDTDKDLFSVNLTLNLL